MSEETPPAGPHCSGRLAAVTSSGVIPPGDSDTQNDSRDNEGSEETPQKRRRGKRKLGDMDNGTVKKRRRKVQLSKLMDMPLDILFEIFGHLYPLDLLHLTRTAKAFRDVLMRRSATAVWKQARGQLEGLPDCPSDLSEPQYANLLFDAHCHFCLSARVMIVMWACRARCCKNCWDTHFTPTGLLNINFVQDVPLATMVPKDSVKGIAYTRQTNYDGMLRLSGPFRRDTSSAEEGKKFVQEKLAEMEEIRKSVSKLVIWQEHQADLRAKDKLEIRERRRNAILHELRQLGWGEEWDRMNIQAKSRFERHALVKQPREFTPRIWSNIKHEMVAFMEQVQKQRLDDERFEVLTERAKVLSEIIKPWTSQQPRTEFFPLPAEYCSMPEIKTIVEKWDMDLAAPFDEVEVTGLLPELAQRWRDSVSRRLLCLIPGHEDTPEDGMVDLSPLHLATTWFRCKICLCNINFPRILIHACMTRRPMEHEFIDWSQPSLPKPREGTLQEAMSKLLNQSLWGTKKLVFNEPLYQTARKVLKSCGMDTERTTAGEMDELDARIICGESHCMRAEVRVMSWRNALLHRCASSGFSLSHPSKFFVIGSEYMEGIRASEEAILHDYSNNKSNSRVMWECLLCDRVRLHMYSYIKKHLDDLHNITEPVQGRDYDVSRDSHFSYPGPPVSVCISSRLLHGMEDMEWLDN